MDRRFDIFISFKATDNGEVTRDSQAANDLYRLLTQSGYRVFFSSQTLLEGKSSDFSSEIDSALDEARLLIVVSTKVEYINSGWVRHEWNTFNADILSNIKKNAQIITFTDGINTKEMPRVLRYVQNYRFADEDNMLTFINGFFGNQPIAERVDSGVGGEKRSVPRRISAEEHSVYDSAGKGELEIFRLRERRNYKIDIEAISYVKSQMNRQKYNVLVLGCAYGFVAESRFGLDDDMETVICIDKNEEVIAKAKELYKDYPHMKFYAVEIQSESYVERLRDILKENGIDAIDIVYCADVFRYFTNAQTCIRNTRKFMRAGGFLISKGGDDANKMAYPDEEHRLDDLLDACRRLNGMPNYDVGRELPLFIQNAGLYIREIKIDLMSTINMTFEEKENLFIGTFTRRKNIAKQILSRDPLARAEVERLISAVDRFEEIFYDASFWYSESNMLFVAQKK